jgi:formate hydrogenlyase subunit 3/multisubunit Na+/H+ antiporter MnhD subunit
MMFASILLIAALATPLAMLLACISGRLRERICGLLPVAPLPGLTAALVISDKAPLLQFPPPFRMILTLDRPGALLLGTAALLWVLAGTFARSYIRGEAKAGRFAEWWLLTLSGNLGVFMAADLVSFYLTYSVVSLAAWGLIVHDDTLGSRRAGAVYLALAVLGEAFLLMAFVFMAQATPNGSLLIRDAVAALPASPWRDASLVLLLLGFGLKIGIVPGHVWMPLAYRAAQIPAAAVLSGAAVKAGIIGLIRFLPFGAAMPAWGDALAAAGLLSAFYGVAIGVTQKNPKTVLAYSSVSQMGLLAAALGMGLAAGNPDVIPGAGFSASNHILVKGGLFLAVGIASTAGPRLWPMLLLPAGILALSLAGLPLTGGALAKFAIKSELGEGVVGVLASLAAAGSTVLMLHFLRRLAAAVASAGAVRPRLTWQWLMTALAAVAVPWMFYPLAQSGARSDALRLGALWQASWPALLGAVTAAALWLSGLQLPRIPAGDIAVATKRAAWSIAVCGKIIGQADDRLREWPVACLSLVIIVFLLAAALWARP